MEVYKLSGESKVAGCCEFIDTLLLSGIKFLIYAHHKSVMDSLDLFLSKKKVEFIRIDGSVPVEKRHQKVQ
jgi:SWI/SNF-related matrix-associated actin-dependent regulator 1 of chromatin subfamily A